MTATTLSSYFHPVRFSPSNCRSTVRRQGSGIRRCHSLSPIIPQHLCCNDQRLEGARVATRHSHRRIPSLLVYSSFIPQSPSDNSSVSFLFAMVSLSFSSAKSSKSNLSSASQTSLNHVPQSPLSSSSSLASSSKLSLDQADEGERHPRCDVRR